MPPSNSTEMAANTALNLVPPTAVREQLGRILNSPALVSSMRLSRFLAYVVNQTLNGELDTLKEFSVAMEVFDRSSDYDPDIDAIVRVQAGRLRAKLKAYYEGAGIHDPVLIALRPGSYKPIFRHLDTQKFTEPDPIEAIPEKYAASVAVLPFVNMSPDPEQNYFCDGISEEIINSLTRISGLKVISRTSGFQFKGLSVDIREVGRRLNADVVIEGSVRKAGAQLRITGQAIQAESGYHLWSETYTRELKDVFAIQEEIALSVAGLLRVHMAEPPARLHASDRNLSHGR